MNIVTERFIKCHEKLKDEGIIRSSRQFAKEVKFIPQSLSEILNGKRDVTIELLRKSIEVFHFNPIYVFTGRGSMFLDPEDSDGFKVLTVVTDSDNRERIVHVPVPAQAGYSKEWNDPTFVKELPTFSLPDHQFASGTFRAFTVSGDSMFPTLKGGEIVVCRFIEPLIWKSNVRSGNVYVIITQGDVYVKRIENTLEKDEKLVLISDNNFYTPFPMPGAEIIEVWEVRSVISDFHSLEKLKEENQRNDIDQLTDEIRSQSELIKRIFAQIQLNSNS
jgi:phage repressor protein C with HTH and peptisase S24 domain